MNKGYLFDSRSGETATLSDAIQTSQPISGGLWSIRDFPQVSPDDIQNFIGKPNQEVTFNILSRFDFWVSPDILRKVINEAQWDQWHNSEITPVKHVTENLYSLHLGYGPTFAFKNVALEFLPRLLAELTRGKIVHVLGASSGDTINAAHSGVKWTNIRSIFMLPENGPSKVQKLQAIEGIVNNPNAVTLLSKAPFDPLQDIVKKINGPEFVDFKRKYNITSFNSINIARILAQVVYYFRAYAELLKNGGISNWGEAIFSVPSGNFWDALAGYYAKKMWLPIFKILVATNENDMLDKFFKTGIYEPPKKDGTDFVQVTNAPSMDIAKSSNFERMLFDVCWFDSVKIKWFYDELAKTGKFQVDNEVLWKIQKTFISSSSTDEERLGAIKTFGKFHNHGMDPHTAAWVVPWIRWPRLGSIPVIFLETSHVAQFWAELRNQWIVVPGMDEFDETLDAMRKARPQEWRDYLRVSGDFDTTFPQIKKAITELLPQKWA
ncbi:MAG: threonine synthase [uncultured bacterium (gcode 4)]|uniref:Threonine synthase n=1 Tax=uncultured bacterium (gcode 4) TaxID=1234023 RepID=K1XVZ4_9BACT|nr:MAG: threonine synthase [uncultured bacterium (gcode 4)]